MVFVDFGLCCFVCFCVHVCACVLFGCVNGIVFTVVFRGNQRIYMVLVWVCGLRGGNGRSYGWGWEFGGGAPC